MPHENMTNFEKLFLKTSCTYLLLTKTDCVTKVMNLVLKSWVLILTFLKKKKRNKRATKIPNTHLLFKRGWREMKAVERDKVTFQQTHQ